MAVDYALKYLVSPGVRDGLLFALGCQWLVSVVLTAACPSQCLICMTVDTWQQKPSPLKGFVVFSFFCGVEPHGAVPPLSCSVL